MTGPAVTEHPVDLFGGVARVISFACACGFSTSQWPADLRYEAVSEMAVHLADEHGGELQVGRCSVCRRPTDYFHAHVAYLDTDDYLCELHAPRIPIERDEQ